MKIRKLVIAVAISISAPLCAQAGIMGDLNSMFMSNSTAAGTMKTKDRVGIFAGSVSMRAPIKSVTIIAFDAPRLNAGCGGVDLFGGSFSFINSQQLVQIFRQVAANAAGLAFKAAIKAISPSLDALMTEFQALMQNLNNLAKNSCQMAHMIIDPAEKSISNAVNGDGSVGASQKGMFSDAMGSLTGYLADANSYFKKQGEVNPKSGNRVMKAILASGATNILGLAGLGNQDGSSDDASNPNSLNNKILISFLGYEIDGVPCTTSNEDGAQDSGPVASNNNMGRISCKGTATLTLDSIVKGGGSGSIRASTPLTIYKCVNPSGSGVSNGGFDPQVCTQMQKENFNYQGIQGWVNQMLFGSVTAGVVDPSSIVGKINAGQTLAFTTTQIQFMKHAGLPLIPLLTKTSNTAARISMAERLGAYLSDCVAARFGEAIYKSANSVEYGHNHLLNEDIKKNIDLLRSDYMEKQNACIKDTTVLRIAQELTASATLNGNTK
jgi:conjugative transfer pilus assembly protein TraH